MSLDSLAARIQRLHDATRPRWQLIQGNCLDVVPTLGAKRFRCIVTSPPYFLKRAYDVPATIWGGDPGHDHEWEARTMKGMTGGKNSVKLAIKYQQNFQVVPDQQQAICACGAWSGQVGLEPTLDGFLENLVAIFSVCWNVLTDDGTMLIVIDDSACGSGRGPSGHNAAVPKQEIRQGFDSPGAYTPTGMKPKDLMGVPYELAKALRSRGWYWRADIIWHKPNGFGNATDDRPTHTYEHVLMFSKSRRYFYNQANSREPAVQAGRVRADRWGGNKYTAKTTQHSNGSVFTGSETRVIRDVWTIPTEPNSTQHYAAMPTALAARCIALGSRPGDEVLDPFSGISRTGIAALRLRRSFVGVDLGQEYLSWGAQALEAEQR